MGLCIDVGHTARTGTDAVKAMLDAGPGFTTCTSRISPTKTNRDSQVAVGEGKLPISGIFRALQTIKYPGLREPRVRDQRERSAPRHAGVIRLYAGCPRRTAGIR